MFTVGPADFGIDYPANPDQSIPYTIADDQVAFGYDYLGATSRGGAIMLYQVQPDDQVTFISDIIRI